MEQIGNSDNDLSNEVEKHLEKKFSELPKKLAARIERDIAQILMDPDLDTLLKVEREERDKIRGFSYIAAAWDSNTPLLRLAAVIAADQARAINEMHEKQQQARLAAGRYFVSDAVKKIEDATEQSIGKSLVKAVCAFRIKSYEPGSLVPIDDSFTGGQKTQKSVESINAECYWDDLNVWLSENFPRINYRFPKPSNPGKVLSKISENLKPWEIHFPDDPLPGQSWFTPARYFARELVKGDATLLRKRIVLARQTAEALFVAGYRKRGGQKGFDHSTVLKAFTNVSLG